MKQDKDKQKEKAKEPAPEKSSLKTTIASPAKAKASSEEKQAKKAAAPKEAAPQNTVVPMPVVNQTPRASDAPASEGRLAPVTPISVAIHNRDRRNNSEGRRGRFAEKTPPGTRTKMLKIIYERKQEIQEKKRYQLIIKVCVAVVLMASLFFAGKAIVGGVYDLGVKTYDSLEVNSWLDRLSVPVKVPVNKVPMKTAPVQFAPRTELPKAAPKAVQAKIPARKVVAAKPVVAPKKLPAKPSHHIVKKHQAN